jgi:heat shock protein HtpX
MRRFAVFFAVNAAVLIVIGMLLNLLGVRPYLRSQGVSYDGLLIFCALWGFVGSFVSLQISRWAAKRAMGVQLIDPSTPAGPVQSHLVSRIRELSQRAGLKTLPEIGVYRSPEVNAFATGPSRDRALVAVSTGLLERMDDEAVEGVLGHEISHIANGDMVTMTLVQGVVNTFVMFFARVIAQIIDNFLRSDDDRGGGLGFFGYFIVVSVLDTVLMLLASPIVYAFSRYREYRADAGSAKLTSPQTMIHALEALGRNTGRFDKQDGAIATMKIQGGAHGVLAALFSSHPPIPARIQALRQLTAN